MKNLAIVIPAFKPDFLRETLSSIANQTCNDFSLYIGDDNSPDNLHEIIKGYESSINIIYKKFDNNLGSKDLVSHWTRCIEMTEDEEWIWLFSDDDTMDRFCVEKFYNFIEKNEGANLLHFDINIINQEGTVINDQSKFPKCLSVQDFFSKRINIQIQSTAVEYIFKRSSYLRTGFKNYDLAWCSDDATWIQFGNESGILTIPDAKVNWRNSGKNISAISNNRQLVLRKFDSNIEHVNWVKEFFRSENLNDSTTSFEKLKWVTSGLLLSSVFSLTEKYRYAKKAVRELNYPNLYLLTLTFVTYIHFKRKHR